MQDKMLHTFILGIHNYNSYTPKHTYRQYSHVLTTLPNLSALNHEQGNITHIFFKKNVAIHKLLHAISPTDFIYVNH